jgi:putative two-component system response regulator
MNKYCILCVDDEYIILESLRQEMRGFNALDDAIIETADSGAMALEIMEDLMREGTEIAVVLSDQRMPGMTGDRFLEEAHRISPDTMNILLTGYSDIDAIVNAVNRASLYRYLSKPWEPNDLLLTVTEAYGKYIQNRLIEEKNRKIEKITIAMVSALENVNYYNDEDTGRHIKRITLYSEMIASRAGFDDQFVKRVKLYSSLHDVGKVGVRKDLLVKPAPLDPDEFDEVKRHVLIGYKMLENDEIDVMARNIALYHHERWDGGGYMQGLRGDEIPVEARIVAIGDVFDSLINERVYKPAFTLEESLAILREDRGRYFDPALLDLFLGNIDSVMEISRSL